MKLKFSITERNRGKEYGGSLEIGTRKLDWTVKFALHIDELDKELAHRMKRGQDVKSLKVKKELFDVALFDGAHKLEVPEDSLWTQIAPFLIGKADNFYHAPISDVWNVISGGMMASPFGIQEEFEIDGRRLPKCLR